jgi:hypothetical protein
LVRAQSGWTSDPAAEEFRSLKPNRALLETIAKQTGGEMVAMNALEAFAEEPARIASARDRKFRAAALAHARDCSCSR